MAKFYTRVSQGEVVAAMIMNSGKTITNDLKTILDAYEQGYDITWLTRQEMQFMAAADLGPNWDKLARGVAWFKFDGDECTTPDGKAIEMVAGEKPELAPADVVDKPDPWVKKPRKSLSQRLTRKYRSV